MCVSQILTITTTVCNSATSIMMTGPWGIGILQQDQQLIMVSTWTHLIQHQQLIWVFISCRWCSGGLVAAGTSSGDWSCTSNRLLVYANRQWTVGSGQCY